MTDLLDFVVALAAAAVVLARRGRAAARGRRSAAVVVRRLLAATRAAMAGRAADVRVAAPRTRSAAPTPARSPRSRGATRRIPSALSTIADPPPVLWMRGSLGALERTRRSRSSARAPRRRTGWRSPNGSRPISPRAASSIVSGLARGVDSAAHRGALAAGGATVAVLGSGVDVIYPPSTRRSRATIDATGAVISELVPGTPPQPRFFPLRNRIISGLSRAVVVIEAGEKSGSLITARCALEQGRDVLAVPGNVLSGRNRGGHALLAGRCKDRGVRGRYP